MNTKTIERTVNNKICEYDNQVLFDTTSKRKRITL